MRKKTQKLTRKGPHRVYWGTHGCYKQRGHLGHCRCHCGSILQPEYYVYGEDAKDSSERMTKHDGT